jgi:hypothetical protein
MPDDFQSKLQIALWGALAGGIVSLIVNFFLQSFLPWLKRARLTRSVQVYAEVSHGVHARCRVYNGGFWTMGNAIAYITLNVTEEDVLNPPNGQDAFIKPGQFVPVADQQLCWSVRSPTVNPMRVDIFAKERQPFAPCAIDTDTIMIPSEEGWTFPCDRPRIARVFLRQKQYNGFLKIVSADTNARFFALEIHPENSQHPLTVRALSARESKQVAAIF